MNLSLNKKNIYFVEYLSKNKITNNLKMNKPYSFSIDQMNGIVEDTYAKIINECENLKTNTITVTEVRISQDLKIAKAYVLPLGGKNAEETVNTLKEYSFLIRKILSQKVVMKFLPKLLFRKDESFEYAEKIENLIKQTNK